MYGMYNKKYRLVENLDYYIPDDSGYSQYFDGLQLMETFFADVSG
jgi:hypothetical protein